MPRPEPFRALLEEAYRADGKGVAAPVPARATAVVPETRSIGAPSPLSRRLDAVLLAGATPARGVRAPGAPPALHREDARAPLPPPPLSNPSQAVLEAMEVTDVTDRMERPFHTPSLPSRAEVMVAVAPMLQNPPLQNAPRPPPLPATRAPLKSSAPAPVWVGAGPLEPFRAPPPRIQALLDDNTLPSLQIGRSSSSSGSSKLADGYRLQPEFEDTPARPLPRNASLPPLPAAEAELTRPVDVETLLALDAAMRRSLESPLVGPEQIAGLESTDLHRMDLLQLEDADGIADLDMMARAMGLRGVGEVSIPSMDGDPVTDDVSDDVLPVAASQDAVGPSDGHAALLAALAQGPDPTQVPLPDAPLPDNALGDNAFAGNALGDNALGDNAFAGNAFADNAFADNAFADNAFADSAFADSAFADSAFADSAFGTGGDPARPALAAGRAVTPVIVKIPSRPRVSAENRERGRRLYLSAVDALARGDRQDAIGTLRLALELDDANPLYPELLSQLEKQTQQKPKSPRSTDGPALMVQSASGKLRRPNEFPRYPR